MTLPMLEIGCVVLRGQSVPLNSDVGRTFIEDCARYTESLLSEADIKGKWGISDEAWLGLEQNLAVLDSVQQERERRVMNGVSAAEAARRQFVRAPSVLGGILSNDEVSPRHRIEAARELRAIVGANGDPDRQVGEKFTVVINLGADEKRVYDFNRPNLDLLRGDE
jgi:hypothetical protein